jgi:ABC-type nitrate/sulfonate/bicarbonate transport system substrate-binding protein
MKFRFALASLLLLAMSPISKMAAQPLQKITMVYPTRSAASWPMFLAKEGGYYQKYGLDVNLVFAVHPGGVAMLVSGEGAEYNSSLEQAMQAAVKDGSFVIMGSSLNKGLFALMGRKGLNDIKEVKGKLIAVSQIGDAPYNYTVALLGKNGIGPRDVQWVPVGTDVNGRVAALTTGRVDATLLTAPSYFRLEETGYKVLADLADHDDIFASTTYMFSKATIQKNPKLPEQIIRAQAEAIKRFYDDKAFALKTYITYDKQKEEDMARIYDRYNKTNGFERIPFVLAGAISSVIAQQVDQTILAQFKAFDFHKVIDNSVIDRLIKEGFFEKTFGAGIKPEEDKKSKLAFR